MDEILANALKTLENSRKLRDDGPSTSKHSFNERKPKSTDIHQKAKEQRGKNEGENSDDSSLSDILKELGKNDDEKFVEEDFDYDISSVTSKLESSLKKPLVKFDDPKSELSLSKAKNEGANSKFRPIRISRSEVKSCSSKQDMTIDENSSIRTELEEDSSLEEIKTEPSEIPKSFSQPPKQNVKNETILHYNEEFKESPSHNTTNYDEEEFNSETVTSKNGDNEESVTVTQEQEKSLSASFSLNVKSKIYSLSEDGKNGFSSKKSGEHKSRDSSSSKYSNNLSKPERVSKSETNQSEQKSKTEDYEDYFLSEDEKDESSDDSESNKNISRSQLLTHFIHKETSDSDEEPSSKKEQVKTKDLSSHSASATFLSHENTSIRETMSKRISAGTILFNAELKKQIEINNKKILQARKKAKKIRNEEKLIALKKLESISNSVSSNQKHSTSIAFAPKALSNQVESSDSEREDEKEERERFHQIGSDKIDTPENESSEEEDGEDDDEEEIILKNEVSNASDKLKQMLEEKLKIEDDEEDKKEEQKPIPTKSSETNSQGETREVESGIGLNTIEMVQFIQEVETQIAKTIHLMGKKSEPIMMKSSKKPKSEDEDKKKSSKSKNRKTCHESKEDAQRPQPDKFVFVDKVSSKHSSIVIKKKEKSDLRKIRPKEKREKSEKPKRERGVEEIEDTIRKALDLKNEIEVLEHRISSSQNRYSDFEGESKKKKEKEAKKKKIEKKEPISKEKFPRKSSHSKDKIYKERTTTGSKERINKEKTKPKKENKQKEFRKTWKESTEKIEEADAAWDYLFKSFESNHKQMGEKEVEDSSLMDLEKKLKKAFEDKKTTTEVDVLHAFVEEVLESNKRMHRYALEACRDIEKEYNKKIRKRK